MAENVNIVDYCKLVLPCAVQLPSGTTFGEGIALGIFLEAAERQAGEQFPVPASSPLYDIDKEDLRAKMMRITEEANLQAEIMVQALRDANFDAVLKRALSLLPVDWQLEIADALLHNIGKVAINESWLRYDDTEPPELVAMRAWCEKHGYVAVEAGKLRDLEAANG